MSIKDKTYFCLPTVSVIALVLLLDWIVSGELTLTRTNAIDVLETAEFLSAVFARSGWRSG